MGDASEQGQCLPMRKSKVSQRIPTGKWDTASGKGGRIVSTSQEDLKAGMFQGVAVGMIHKGNSEW